MFNSKLIPECAAHDFSVDAGQLTGVETHQCVGNGIMLKLGDCPINKRIMLDNLE